MKPTSTPDDHEGDWESELLTPIMGFDLRALGRHGATLGSESTAVIPLSLLDELRKDSTPPDPMTSAHACAAYTDEGLAQAVKSAQAVVAKNIADTKH